MKYILQLLVIISFNQVILSQDSFDDPYFDTIQLVNSSWYKFYYEQNTQLTAKAFCQLDSKRILTYTKGNVFGDFDPKFSNCNKSFIVSSPNRNLYIDFLSYSTLVQESGDSCKVLGFEVDQEVDLVDRINKTITRIIFLGSYEMVEDIIWIDNSQILMLCCTKDQKNGTKLFVELVNLDSGECSLFISPDCFDYNSCYLLKKYGF